MKIELTTFSELIPSPWWESLPWCLIAVTTLLVLVLEILRPGRWIGLRRTVGLIGLMLAALFFCVLWWLDRPLTFGGFYFDRLAYLICLLLIGMAAIAYLLESSFFAYLGISVLGAICVVQAADLITAYWGLELMSFPFIVRMAAEDHGWRAQEARLKLFISLALSSVLLLLGIAFLTSIVGTTDFVLIAERATTESFLSAMPFLIGILLLLFGILLRMSAIPFHWFFPDLAEGGEGELLPLLTVSCLVGTSTFLLRFFFIDWPLMAHHLTQLFQVLAILTLIISALQMLSQLHFKRLLAFGLLHQVGWILMLLSVAGVAHHQLGQVTIGLLFYLVMHGIISGGLYAVIVASESGAGSRAELPHFIGLARRHPWISAALSVLLLAMAGFPPTIGFIAKFKVLALALEADLYVVAAVSVISGVVAAYCYLDVIVAMYFKQRVLAPWPALSYGIVTTMALAVVAVLYWGLFPSNLIILAQHTVASLGF